MPGNTAYVDDWVDSIMRLSSGMQRQVGEPALSEIWVSPKFYDMLATYLLHKDKYPDNTWQIAIETGAGRINVRKRAA